MSSDAFDQLDQLLQPAIQKQNANFRPICVKERLAVTLRYLASGDYNNHSAGSIVLARQKFPK